MGSVAPARVAMPLVLTALAVGAIFPAAPAHAQVIYCVDQGVILEKSTNWCQQRAHRLPVDDTTDESVHATPRAEIAQLQQDGEKRNDAQKPGQNETAAGAGTGGDTLSGGDVLRFFLFNPLTILAALVAAYFLRPTALLRRRVRRQLARATGLADIPPILAGLTERQLAACLKQRLAYFRHHVETRIAGDVLDDAGMTALKDVQSALRLSDIDIGRELPRMRNAQARYHLRQGRLPELTGTALVERPGEKTHFVTSATLHEERKSEGATTSHRGWAIPLPLGIGHTRNTFDTRTVTNRQQEPVGLGMFYITNQRLVFTGDLEALSIDYAYVLAAEPVAEGVSISLHAGNARLIRFAIKESIPLGHEILKRVAP